MAPTTDPPGSGGSAERADVAPGRRSSVADVDQGTAMLSSLLSGPLAWGLIGWGLDRWLGTEPWLLVAGVVLGAVLGFYLVVKRSEAAHTPRQRRPAP